MVTTKQRFQEIFQSYIQEFIYTTTCIEDVNGEVTIKGEPKTFMPLNDCVRLDKPMYIYSSNTSEYTGEVVEKEDRYEIHFPRFGKLGKTYTDDLAWVLDKDTVFYFERPYRNRLKTVLQKLVGENSVVAYSNDIAINDVKIGPAFITGYIRDLDSGYHELNGGIIYCLRWTNMEGLHKTFEGNNNHLERMNNPYKIKFGTLDQFLNISKEEFEELLEKEL